MGIKTFRTYDQTVRFDFFSQPPVHAFQYRPRLSFDLKDYLLYSLILAFRNDRLNFFPFKTVSGPKEYMTFFINIRDEIVINLLVL